MSITNHTHTHTHVHVGQRKSYENEKPGLLPRDSSRVLPEIRTNPKFVGFEHYKCFDGHDVFILYEVVLNRQIQVPVHRMPYLKIAKKRDSPCEKKIALPSATQIKESSSGANLTRSHHLCSSVFESNPQD